MSYSNYSSRGRLQKIEERKNRRQAIIFTLLTIIFLLALLIFGIPAFIRLIGTLGDVRSSKVKPDKTDTIAPIPPTIFSQWEATSSSKVKIAGYGEPGSKITLKLNENTESDTFTLDDGSFNFDLNLKPGDNVISVFALDLAGNQSTESRVLNILYDNEPPTLELLSPEDGTKFYDEKEKEQVVGGTTDVDASVKVNGFIATVDTEGNFARRIQLNNGENEITIESIDAAGNRTEKKIKVSYNP